jgi:hypothetical protein
MAGFQPGGAVVNFHGDIEHLKANSLREAIVIQNQIVDFYMNSYSQIACSAAVLGGFAFSAFGNHDDWSEFSPLHRLITVNALTASVSFNTSACMLSTHICIQAPGLQLLGPIGSTGRACELLKRWHNVTLWLFHLGMFFLLVAMCDTGFMTIGMTLEDAWTMVAQLVLALGVIVYAVYCIQTEFSFPANIELSVGTHGFQSRSNSNASEICDERRDSFVPGTHARKGS